MEVKSLKCPNCGAALEIPEERKTFFCKYCGSQIYIDDGKITIDINTNINIDNRYTDVARLRELELQEQERERQESIVKKNQSKKLKWVLTLIISILLYILFTFVACITPVELEIISGFIAPVVFAIISIVLLITRPKEWRLQLKTEHNGCVASLGYAILLFGSIVFAI